MIEYCESCGVYIDLSPDIFGRESKEGKRVDDRYLCASCIEKLEEAGELP